MKALLIFTIIFLSQLGFAANYSYNSYPITKRTYNKLFAQFKAKLFVLTDGRIINLIKPNGETSKISIFKKQTDSGEISGTVKKIINKNTLLLNAKEEPLKIYGGVYYYARSDGKTIGVVRAKTFTVAISGVATSALFTGDTFTANVVAAGACDDDGKRLRQFDVARPITEPEFKKYLAAGNKLYIYRRKSNGYITCEKCQGRGTQPNPNYKKGKLASKTINCPACKYGKIKQYKYVKTPIKPRRKKLASR